MIEKFAISVGRKLSPALAIVAVLAALSLAKHNTTFGGEPSINGTWKLADAKDEKKTRQDAIDQALKNVPRIARSRAAKALLSSTEPSSKLAIDDQGDRVSLTEEKRQFHLVLGGKPIEVTVESGKAQLSGARKKQLFVVTAKSSNATRTTVFRPSKDGKTLVLDVSLSVPRLGATVRYKTNYVRL